MNKKQRCAQLIINTLKNFLELTESEKDEAIKNIKKFEPENEVEQFILSLLSVDNKILIRNIAMLEDNLHKLSFC